MKWILGIAILSTIGYSIVTGNTGGASKAGTNYYSIVYKKGMN